MKLIMYSVRVCVRACVHCAGILVLVLLVLVLLVLAGLVRIGAKIAYLNF